MAQGGRGLVGLCSLPAWSMRCAHLVHVLCVACPILTRPVPPAPFPPAGYPGAPERFEQRVEGLLAAFRRLRLPPSVTDRWVIRSGPGT